MCFVFTPGNLLAFETSCTADAKIPAERCRRVLELLKSMPLPDDRRQQYVRYLVDQQVGNYSFGGGGAGDEGWATNTEDDSSEAFGFE